MSDFIVYAEKKAFDEITFNGSYPNLKSIFTNHSTIFLNLTKDEVKEDILSEGEIFFYLHAYPGANIPKAYPAQFRNVYDDFSTLVFTPRSIYFLNIAKHDADSLQQQYGIIVQSSNDISDNILRGGAHRELNKDMVLNDGIGSGWKSLFDFTLPPSNSLVVTDDWLFKNEEMGNIIGETNIVNFIDAILPIGLLTDFHILIITDDQARTQLLCERLVVDLSSRIKVLREYPIVFELVFADTIHKRKAILNYISITCDKGFAMFRLSDNLTIRDDNDFRYERVFNRIEKEEGDTVFYSDTLLLHKIKDKCISVRQYITNRHQEPNRRILGDCNPDKSLKNRLINDV
jgi:hypothetical protein